MKIIRTYRLLWLVLVLQSLGIFAQENPSVRESYFRAEKNYRIGLFEQSIDCLDNHLKQYDNKMKANAYRLMALCYLAMDREEEATQCVRLLLKLLPTYTINTQDSERFIDLINSCRDTNFRLVTASQQLEKPEEVSVPITVITEDMIKKAGAKNLKEVLLVYVPGMFSVESISEMNIAMHGIYSSGQQKILIMQDGHRLNSRSTNTAAPDYAISLDKIKQIEVLRAPASSLYGNVALTAVVNLITKDGTDINGTSCSIGFGSYQSFKVDFMFGKHLMDGDFMMWSSCYSSNGQTFFYREGQNVNLIPQDGYLIVGGFNKKPVYDLGFRFKWKGFYLSTSLQHSKMIQPFSPLEGGLHCGIIPPSTREVTQSSSPVMGTMFTYGDYAAFDGEKPGSSRNITRLETGYVWNRDPLTFDVALYADFERSTNYDVAGDTIPPVVSFVPVGTQELIYPQRGVFQLLNWNDYTCGIEAKLRYDFHILGYEGNILGGIQYEEYNLYSTSFRLGDDYNRIVWIAPPGEERLLTGTDRNFSFFLQSKQYIHKAILMNTGLRYDYKLRAGRDKIHAFSPRISIVYLINKNWNLKFGYSRAFVDAPYFYRNNTTKAYQGGRELKPEYLDAVYLNSIWNFRGTGFSYDSNLYYNHVSNLICKSNANGNPYRNAGRVSLLGIENSLSYRTRRFDMYLTFSYMRLLNARDYNSVGNQIKGIPEASSNLVIDYDLLPQKKASHSLRLQMNLVAYSRQYGLSGRVLINTGLLYKYKRRIEISSWLYNAFDTSYRMDGDAGMPIQQAGRWFLGKLTIKL